MKKQNNIKGINAMDNRFEITKGLTTGINTKNNPSVTAKGLTAGITLIALVVTIIIILILAGVSISGLAGDNGLIAKTISAKEEAKISELQEKLELKKVEYVADKKENDIGLNKYIEYINDKALIDKNKDVTVTGEENSRYVTLEDKYVFLVEKILETGELKITYQGKVGKLKPIIVNIEVLEKSTNSIKVQVNTRLTKNATYTYYIAEEDGKYEKKDKIDSNIYEYTGLKQGKKYKIKVDVEIKDGGKTYSEITVSLGSIEGLNSSNTTFTYSPSGWTNGNVAVTIKTTVTGYTLQYKTEKTGSSGEVSEWTNYTGAITLTRNQEIYARAIDSSGQSTGYATGKVEKICKIQFETNVVSRDSDSWNFVIYNINNNESDNITIKYKKTNATTWNVTSSTKIAITDPGIYDIQIFDDKGNQSFIQQEYAYVKTGLNLYYDGIRNTRSGNSLSITSWEDLSGNYNDGIIYKGKTDEGASMWYQATQQGFVFIRNDSYIKSKNNIGIEGDALYTVETVATSYTKNMTGASDYWPDESLIRGILWFGSSTIKNPGSFVSIGYMGDKKQLGVVYDNNIIANQEELSLYGKRICLSYTRQQKGKISIGTTGVGRMNINGTTISLNHYKGTTNVSYESFTPNIENSPVEIGRFWQYNEENRTLFGSVSAVRIYNRALTDEEVKINYEIDNARFMK